jgi:hypothetical protein
MEGEYFKMKKVGFIFSCTSIVIAIVTLITTSILNQLLPKLGYLIFQANTNSYSSENYIMDFTFTNGIAGIIIVIGIILGIYFCSKETK